MESPELLNACFVGCNTDEKVWQYGRIQRGVMLGEQQQFDPTLRANVFVDVLVQVCTSASYSLSCRRSSEVRRNALELLSFCLGPRACRFVAAP